MNPEKDSEQIPPASHRLDPAQVLKATEGLLQIAADGAKKSRLLDGVVNVNLQFNMKKIASGKNKRFSVKVPHSLVTDDTDVCLFVKDVHKEADDRENNRDYEPSVRHFKKVVADAGVKGLRIEEVIPIIRLKREFKEFETQRKLCDSYDLFLADDRIFKFLPRLLGKSFYKKRKLPVSVKLGHDRVASSLERVLNSTHGLLAGKGSSENVRVGHTGLTAAQIADNVVAVVEHLAAWVVVGGWNNLRSLYLTTTDTTAVPIYLSMTSGDEVELPPEERRGRKLVAKGDPGLVGDGEDDGDDEGDVEVYDDGSIKVAGEPMAKRPKLNGKRSPRKAPLSAGKKGAKKGGGGKGVKQKKKEENSQGLKNKDGQAKNVGETKGDSDEKGVKAKMGRKRRAKGKKKANGDEKEVVGNDDEANRGSEIKGDGPKSKKRTHSENETEQKEEKEQTDVGEKPSSKKRKSVVDVEKLAQETDNSPSKKSPKAAKKAALKTSPTKASPKTSSKSLTSASSPKVDNPSPNASQKGPLNKRPRLA